VADKFADGAKSADKLVDIKRHWSIGMPGIGALECQGIGVPGIGVPGVGVPGVGVPGVGVPGIGVPGVGVTIGMQKRIEVLSASVTLEETASPTLKGFNLLAGG